MLGPHAIGPVYWRARGDKTRRMFTVAALGAAHIPEILAAEGGPWWRRDELYWMKCLEEQGLGHRTAIIAADESGVIGYAYLNWHSQYPRFRTRKIPEISDLRVADRHRRLGVATAMIAHFEGVARQAGCSGDRHGRRHVWRLRAGATALCEARLRARRLRAHLWQCRCPAGRDGDGRRQSPPLAGPRPGAAGCCAGKGARRDRPRHRDELRRDGGGGGRTARRRRRPDSLRHHPFANLRSPGLRRRRAGDRGARPCRGAGRGDRRRDARGRSRIWRARRASRRPPDRA